MLPKVLRRVSGASARCAAIWGLSELRKAALLHAEFGALVGAAATCGCDRLIFVKS